MPAIDGEPPGGRNRAMRLPRPIPDPLAELIAGRLQVLGQPLRIRLIDQLERDGEASVQALADATGISVHNASQHLGVLREAGVVARRQSGRMAYYELADAGALTVYELVASSISDQFRRLGRKLVEGDDEDR